MMQREIKIIEIFWTAKWGHNPNGGILMVKVDKFKNIYVTGESSSKKTGLDFVTLKYLAGRFKGVVLV